MAEIKIEKRRPIWPWILGLLLLMATVAGIYFAIDDDYSQKQVVANDMYDYDTEILPEETIVAIPSEVNAFIVFASKEDAYEEGKMDVHHEYTASAIRSMADAVVALADQKNMNEAVNATQLHEELDAYADYIQKDWKSGTHADSIKVAFLKVSNAVNKMADETSSMNLKAEAKDIDPSTLALEQKQDVKDFVRKTASVMEKLATETK